MTSRESKQWTRQTNWRQGRVLGADAARFFNLKNPIDEVATMAVVISHDCDLADDRVDVEPGVEVIIGRTVPVASGNFTWGKAPRTLHLSMTDNDLPVTVELVATNKCLVRKCDLAQFEPDARFGLEEKGLGVLRSWLSARYNRTAFADAFVDRMKSTKLDVKLSKLLEPHGELISVVYFDIDGGQSVERDLDSPYELSIVLVYPPGDDPDVSADAADAVVEKIDVLCASRLKSKTDIILKTCIALSEDEITVSKARILMQWRLEHMTNKADGHPGPI